MSTQGSQEQEGGQLDPRFDFSRLEPGEIVWRDLQPWLEQQGYLLRPRYRVGWVPE